MKKNKVLQITLLAICLALSNTSSSQTIWLNGGLTRSSLNVVQTSAFGMSDSLFQTPMTAINGSLEIEYAKKKKTSMASEIGLYTAAGSQLSSNGVFPLKVPYLFIQQMFNWYPVALKSWKVSLAIGPRVDYIIGNADDPNEQLFFYNELKVVNKLNFGATGKIGIVYSKARFGFKVNVIRPWKFKNFMSTEQGQDLTKSSSRNFNNASIIDITGKDNVCNFNLGISYNLKKEKI